MTGTIDLGSVNAVDISYMMSSTVYYPNPASDLLAVLVNGSSGGYIMIYSVVDNKLVDQIGTDASPKIPGTAVALDADIYPGSLSR